MLIKKHYLDLKLPNDITKIFKKKEIRKIIYFMKKDKKNIDEKINLILLKKIGKTTKPKKFRLDSDEISKFLNGKIIGRNLEIKGLCDIENGRKKYISFILNKSYTKYLKTTKASALIISSSTDRRPAKKSAIIKPEACHTPAITTV